MALSTKGKQAVHYALPPHVPSEANWVRNRVSCIDVTEGLRSLMLEGETIARSNARAFPSRNRLGNRTQRRRSSPPMPIRMPSGSAQRRPRLMKALTAPAGSFSPIFAKPQPPRRAISARIAGPHQSQDGRIRRQSPRSPLLPRMSQLGTPESRSLIHRRTSSVKSRQQPKGLVWRLVPPETQKKYESISDVLEDRKGTSFSEKLRVKETLKDKKVWNLDTNIVDFKQRGLPTTPGSLASTPKELYGRASPGPRSHPGRRPPLMSISANQSKHLGVPSRPTLRERRLKDRSEKRSPQLYVPGPIKMINTSGKDLASSVATLEPFLGVIQSNSRRSSDDDVLDEIAAYFEDYGIWPEATDDELDRFWETETEQEDEEIEDEEMRPKLSAKAMKTLGLDLETLEAAAGSAAGSLRSPSIRSTVSPSIASEFSQPRMKLRRFLGLPTVR